MRNLTTKLEDILNVEKNVTFGPTEGILIINDCPFDNKKTGVQVLLVEFKRLEIERVILERGLEGDEIVSLLNLMALPPKTLEEKGGFKEIFEQPRAAQETLLGRISLETGDVFLGELEMSQPQLRAIERVMILACGTSWHAGLIGKFFIEQLVQIPVEVDYGSEYRYRDPIIGKSTLVIVITQSGETADTLAALKEARRKGAQSIAICNVVGSMATR
ncbi:MAG: SIS domain-containing protein, partial [Deltaproteobacteria bacterium]|nr:SIS domain-containing protein [Deltaproteobacteria bacterium]